MGVLAHAERFALRRAGIGKAGHAVIRLMIEAREDAYDRRLTHAREQDMIRLENHIADVRRDDDFDTTEAWEEGNRIGSKDGREQGRDDAIREFRVMVAERHRTHAMATRWCKQGLCGVVEDMEWRLGWNLRDEDL